MANEEKEERRIAEVLEGKAKKDSTEPGADLDAESDAEPDAAPLSQAPTLKKTRIRKSKKRGCMANFVARQVYLDNTLCEIQYYHMDHTNIRGELCHGVSVNVVPQAYLKPSSSNKNQHKTVHTGCEGDRPTCHDGQTRDKQLPEVIELSDLEPSVPSSDAKPELQDIHELFTSILDLVKDDEALQEQLIADLISIRDKLRAMRARGRGGLETSSLQSLFANGDGGVTFEQPREMVEHSGKDKGTLQPRKRKHAVFDIIRVQMVYYKSIK